MNISARREAVSSHVDASRAADAGQSEHIAKKGLVRGFYRSVAAACAIPPLVAVASVLPLEAEGAVIVTAWSALMLTYVLTTLHKARADLRTGARKWEDLCDNALALEKEYDRLEQAHERLQNKYNLLYAELLIERGAVPLVAKKISRGAAADSSGALNGSAAVLPFHKTDGGA